jgi:hypothetical protein
MAKSDKTETCGAAMQLGDERTGDCVRDVGRHLIHRDAGGVRTIKTPGGAFIAKP